MGPPLSACALVARFGGVNPRYGATAPKFGFASERSEEGKHVAGYLRFERSGRHPMGTERERRGRAKRGVSLLTPRADCCAVPAAPASDNLRLRHLAGRGRHGGEAPRQGRPPPGG